ncbi:MAG: acyltransferase family protein, partial [Rickettsiales bacterium]|nr:acyltransferase family protein [Rickettsiales bacterium]
MSSIEEAAMKKQKINSIELFRIFVVVCVFMRHFAPKPVSGLIINGSNIFFIIAGFFLYGVAEKVRESNLSIGDYIGRRFGRIAMPLFFALILAASIGMFSWTRLPVSLSMAPELLINMHPMGGTWYVFALFWAQILLFGILTKMQRDKALFVIGILGAAACYALVAGNGLESIDKASLGFANDGMLRGIFGASLGVLVGCAADRFNPTQIAGRKKAMVSAAELGLLALFVCNHLSGERTQIAELSDVIIFAWLLFMMAANRGYMAAILNRQNWLAKISRYVYPAYVLQYIMMNLTRAILHSHSLFWRPVEIIV